jgi:hypothetical protein
MSDIQAPNTQQLTQALQQLSKLAPHSETARLGVEVIVKHLAGNTLNLSSPGNAQNRNVSLPARNLQGQLQNTATYTVKVSASENPILQFFSSATTADRIKIPLTSQQLQALLKLPADQIIRPILSKFQSHSSQAKSDTSLLLNARVESHINNQLLVKITGQNQPLPIQLPAAGAAQFKAKDTLQIELVAKGSKWQAKVTSILLADGKIDNVDPRKGLTEQLPLSKKVGKSLEGSAQKLATQTLKTHNILISPEQATALLKAAITFSAKNKAAFVQLPVQTIMSQLPNKLSENIDGLLNKLSQLSSEKVTLGATSAGQFELLGSRSKPAAQLPVSKDILAALAQIKNPQNNSQTSVENPKFAAPTQYQGSSSTKVANSLLNPKSTEQHTIRANTETRATGLSESIPKPLESFGAKTPNLPSAVSSTESPTIRKSVENLSSKATSAHPTASQIDSLRSTSKIPPEASINKSITDAQANITSSAKTINIPVPAEKTAYSAKLSSTEVAQTKISAESKPEAVINGAERSSVPSSRPEQIKLIQTLLRVVNARAELPAETLNRIQLAVTDPQFSKDNSLKELVEPLVQQIKQAVVQGKDTDALQIRQLISAPALTLSAMQLVAPPASQGLLGGLVALVQISLASRLLRNQPSQLDGITQTLGSLIAGRNKAPSSTQTARGLADFFQMEQKHQLLKEIGRLLSGHQANKLTSAEQAIQGQDSFYYTLPSAFDDKLKDIELLIRRESEAQQEQSKDETEVRSWHLTMKLSVGEQGELLTKAKLRPDHLEIDFYASNESTKEQVFNFLPLLKKRFESLGIEVAKSQCQLGKIPSTLQQRPYQVFETRV